MPAIGRLSSSHCGTNGRPCAPSGGESNDLSSSAGVHPAVHGLGEAAHCYSVAAGRSVDEEPVAYVDSGVRNPPVAAAEVKSIRRLERLTANVLAASHLLVRGARQAQS